MKRKTVVLASALVLGAVAVLVVLGAAGLTQTAVGRDLVRQLIAAQLERAVVGRVHVGAVGGNLVTGLTIDSLELRDPGDSLFVATGPVRVAYDLRDLLDRRILLRELEVANPVVRITRGADGEWNYRRVFPRRPKGAPRPRGSFGEFVVIDSATVRGGEFVLALPWRPDETLRGAARDSAVRFNLARADADIRAADTGYVRRWHWRDIQAALGAVRLAHPDTAGRRFLVRQLATVENDPPFRFRDVAGDVRWLGDSIWFDVPHFDLPASTGRAEGKIVWGSRLPIRYDVTVHGDSVSLADVAWVYPTLPREGGGTVRLTIRNDPEDLDLLDYGLEALDVRSTHSRLRGRMTFGVGAPLLRVKAVDLRADPVDLRLLETLGGGPFPKPWRGALTGTVRGPGGPLDRFVVDTAAFVFADANVPGAVARGGGHGMLDITEPAFAVFRGFDATLGTFDLRTARFLDPEFPRLGGTVSGRARLDSVWTDVRFRDARLVHEDGDGPATRAQGSGRVTLEPEFVRYDLALQLEPLSLTTLARSYPALPLRGPLAGPLTVKGTIADLALAGRLTSAAGTFDVDARLDALAPGFGAGGRLAFERVDVSELLGRLDVPSTALSGLVLGQLRGASASTLAGDVALSLDASRVDSIGVLPSVAQLRFADGRVRVDTLRLETAAGTLRAEGGLGLAAGTADTLRLQLTADSLGAWRRGPLRADSTPDPLAGRVALRLAVVGALARDAAGTPAPLALDGSLSVRDVDAFGVLAERLDGNVSGRDLLGEASGRVALLADTVRVGGTLVETATLGGTLDRPGAGRLTLSAATASGAEVAGSAAIASRADTLVVVLDSLAARLRGDAPSAWRLAAPATFATTRGGLRLDSLALAGPDGARLLAAAELPIIDPIRLTLVGERVPLRDVGALTRLGVPLDGEASFAVAGSGTRDAPRYLFDGRVSAARIGDVRVSELRARGDYERQRLTTEVVVARADTALLRARADVPLDLALLPRPERVLEAPLSGYVQAERVDLAVLESFTTALRDAAGRFTIDARFEGTPRAPSVRGLLAVADGAATLPALGRVRVRDLDADIAFLGDSIEVRGVRAASGDQRSSSLLLRGGIGFAERERPRVGLELQLRDFHVIGRSRFADLDVSTTPNLRLRGPLDSLVVTGGVRVERGSVYLPELSGKQVIALDDPALYEIVDTTRAENRSLFPSAPAVLANLALDDVEVAMGNEVWLRGPEANVNLGGRLRLTTTGGRAFGGGDQARLALDGTLIADRGTYRLNLGVVQRTFEIEQGTVRFYNDPDFNPSLDIRALYTVRRVDPRSAQPDTRIRATIGGTLADPALGIASADDARLSESDALSFLVLGVPSLQVGGVQGSNEQAATALAISSLGSYLSDRAAGGLFDYVTFQAGGVNPEERAFRDASQSLLAGSRLGLGLQVSDRAFVSVNAGLCQVVDAAYGRGFSPVDFAGALGVKLDYRLGPLLSLAAGVEPGASALYCRATDAARGFAPTPQQWTFDLFRTWRF